MRATLIPMACLALAATAILPVRAKIPPNPGGRAALARFNALDANGDGGLSPAELRPYGGKRAADALFALLDSRGDGRIRLADLARRRNPALLARFRAYDADRQGVVTRRDFPNFIDPALFAALDTNHDGRLSLAELRPAFAGSRATPRARPAPPAPRPARPQTLPYCWVPSVVTHGGAWLEFPVVSNQGRCRTD